MAAATSPFHRVLHIAGWSKDYPRTVKVYHDKIEHTCLAEPILAQVSFVSGADYVLLTKDHRVFKLGEKGLYELPRTNELYALVHGWLAHQAFAA